MKKLIVLFFMAMVGFSLISLNVNADSTRTKKKKSRVAVDENKVITSHSGTLYRISGFAADANATYSVHDASSVGIDGASTQGTKENVLGEGGEATQYDSFPTFDFGEEGIPFVDGLIIMTSTATVHVVYD